MGYLIAPDRTNKDHSLQMISHLASGVYRNRPTGSLGAWPPGSASSHLRFVDPLSQEASLAQQGSYSASARSNAYVALWSYIGALCPMAHALTQVGKVVPGGGVRQGV